MSDFQGHSKAVLDKRARLDRKLKKLRSNMAFRLQEIIKYDAAVLERKMAKTAEKRKRSLETTTRKKVKVIECLLLTAYHYVLFFKMFNCRLNKVNRWNLR